MQRQDRGGEVPAENHDSRALTAEIDRLREKVYDMAGGERRYV